MSYVMGWVGGVVSRGFILGSTGGVFFFFGGGVFCVVLCVTCL